MNHWKDELHEEIEEIGDGEILQGSAVALTFPTQRAVRATSLSQVRSDGLTEPLKGHVTLQLIESLMV